ncbi:hypothetical protein ACIQI7_32095 [Kitasatospora sp. NPDC092039]|uniref:hypothetical protein n=1 Tax=Kitasatospora sp. NPDC092039 TaxID=3364086 RepID=UPI0037F604FA
MAQTLPHLITEAAVLSAAGAGLRHYTLGSALVAAGADATVVILLPGDDPKNGVQNSSRILLCGEKAPDDLRSRLGSRDVPPTRLFARLEQGYLPLGVVLRRGTSSGCDGYNHIELEFDQPLSRAALDAVRPVRAVGPLPAVDWVDHVETDPIQALESFALGWFPADQAGASGNGGAAARQAGDLPEALAAFHRLARLRPALRGFHDPVLEQPEPADGPRGDRLVFARWAQGYRDWSIPWPPREQDGSDPVVWETEDPQSADYRETTVEQEPLSRFLLKYTLFEAMISSPYHARTYRLPAASLDPLLRTLRPVPLSPFMPAHDAARFFVAPGLIAAVSTDGTDAGVGFAALHRGTLTAILDYGFRWFRFDG